jgi:hypothetical protein
MFNGEVKWYYKAYDCPQQHIHVHQYEHEKNALNGLLPYKILLWEVQF